MAIASLIIHAYKRRAVLNAQDAGIAQTNVGVTYLRYMKNVKTGTCPLDAHHRHLAHGKKTQLFACHGSVKAKRLLFWNAILAITKQ